MAETVVLYSDAHGDAVGGAERAALDLFDALARRGAAPVILHHGLTDALLEGRRAEQVERPAPGIAGVVAAARMARRLRALRPAALHATLSWQGACRYGLLAARLARVPRVVAVLQLGVALDHARAPGAIGRLGAPHVGVAVSSALAPLIATWFDLPADRVHVVENTVRVDRLQGATALSRAALGLPEGPPLLLALARLAPEKGLDVLLDALALLPDGVLAIAGDGPLAPALAAQVERLGLDGRVRLLGRREDVPALLAAADIAVLPSRNEGTPLAVLEAMAAGLPVVATRIPGIVELVDDGVDGVLVPVDDAAALAAALAGLVGDPARRSALGAAARATASARAERPSSERVADLLLGSEEPRAGDAPRWSAGPAWHLDWRFLLPDPAPASVHVAARGALGAAARALGPAARDDADLVVLSGGSRRALRRAAGRVAPGGALYLEDARLLRPPLGRTLRALAEAGLDDARASWTWPPRARGGPNVVVPYGDGAAAALLAGRRPPRGGLRGLVDRLLPRALVAAQRLGVVGPVAIVAAREGVPVAPRRVLLTVGRADVNKVVMVDLEGAEPVIRKVARVPAGERGLVREADALEALPADAPAPRLLARERAGPFTVIAESLIEGVPLARVIDRASYGHHARAVAAALARLARPDVPAPWDAARAEALAAADALGVGPAAAARLPTSLTASAAFEHRDAAPWNVLVTAAGQITLADWESAAAAGLPTVDHAYFLTTAALLVEGELTPACAARAVALWRADDALARELQALAAAFATARGVDRAAAEALRLAAWLRHAGGERARLGGQPGLWQRIAQLELDGDAA